MTFWDVLAACGRRWTVLVAGLIVTAALAGFVVIRAPAVYWSQVDLVFLAPPSQRYPNNLASSSQSLIMTAGIVVNKVNEGVDALATASDRVTMVDEGILTGTMIRLPDSGGQWSHNFDRSVLDVQAAGATPEKVSAELANAVARVQSALSAEQEAAGVSPENTIRIQSAPATAQVFQLRGEPLQALLATVILGLGLSIAGVVYADRRWSGRANEANTQTGGYLIN